jgi:lactate dehydrogenase-like 2-hydroxyacid dehydrogenase
MAHNSDALPIVVGLGDVDPSSVNPALERVARFVREPEASDLAHAVGAIVRAHVNVDQGLFAQMPQLKVLARTGVGTERVDLSEAARRGIPVVITPGSNTAAVAEGSLAHLLALWCGRDGGANAPPSRWATWPEGHSRFSDTVESVGGLPA